MNFLSDDLRDVWLDNMTTGPDNDEGWWEADHGLRCPNCYEYFTEKQGRVDRQREWHCYWCASNFLEDWASGEFGDYGRYRQKGTKRT